MSTSHIGHKKGYVESLAAISTLVGVNCVCLGDEINAVFEEVRESEQNVPYEHHCCLRVFWSVVFTSCRLNAHRCTGRRVRRVDALLPSASCVAS